MCMEPPQGFILVAAKRVKTTRLWLRGEILSTCGVTEPGTIGEGRLEFLGSYLQRTRFLVDRCTLFFGLFFEPGLVEMGATRTRCNIRN